MSTESEMSGLLKIAGEKKGLLIAASIFSILSSLLQIAPFCGGVQNCRGAAQKRAKSCRHRPGAGRVLGRCRFSRSGRGTARAVRRADVLAVRTAGAGSDYGTGRTVRQRKKHRDSPDRPLLGRAAGSGGLAGEIKQTIIPSKRRGFWRCQAFLCAPTRSQAFQARAGSFCSKTSSFFSEQTRQPAQR